MFHGCRLPPPLAPTFMGIGTSRLRMIRIYLQQDGVFLRVTSEPVGLLRHCLSVRNNLTHSDLVWCPLQMRTPPAAH